MRRLAHIFGLHQYEYQMIIRDRPTGEWYATVFICRWCHRSITRYRPCI